MQVNRKLRKLEAVFTSDPYIDVWAEGNTKESLIAQGRVSAKMYDRQIMAWAFLSQAFQTTVDLSKFHRGTSPRKVWEKTVDWHDTKTSDQKRVCMQGMHNFKIGKQDNPVEKFFEIEDFQEKLIGAGVVPDANTTYACFLNALPQIECALEILDIDIRDIGLKPSYDRKEILHLGRNRYETLQKSKGKVDNVHALVCEGGGGLRGGGGRGKGGRERGGGKSCRGSGKGGGNDGTATRAGKDMNSVICWRCRAKGHFSNDYTTKICDTCGGRGYDSSKCPSLTEMASFVGE